MAKSNVELRRANFNMPKDLYEKVEKFGQENGINTTSGFIVLIKKALDNRYFLDMLPVMLELLCIYMEQEKKRVETQN